MNKSITQTTQNDNHIFKSIKRLFTRLHISSALKVNNAYKRKVSPITEIFQYMSLLIGKIRLILQKILCVVS